MKASPYVVAAALLLTGASLAPRAESAPRQEEGRRAGKGAFGLTDEQKDKLRSLRRSHREAAAALDGELKAGLRKLKDQLQDEASDKELAATLDSIARTRKAQAAQREKRRDAMDAVLTPPQRARLLVGRERMSRHRAGRSFRGRHARGGGGRRSRRMSRDD